MKRFYLLAGLFIYAQLLVAQSVVHWSKKSAGFWHTAANWDCNCVPSAGDIVVIDHDSVIVASGQSAYAKQIILGAPDSMHVGLAVFVNAELTIDVGNSFDTAFLVRGNAVFNAGEIHIRNGNLAQYISNTTTLTNNGTITMSKATNGWVNKGLVTNSVGGLIMIDSLMGNSSAAIINEDAILNLGEIMVEGNGEQVGLSHQSDAYFDNDGLLRLEYSTTGLDVIDSAQFRNDGRVIIFGGTFGVQMADQGELLNYDYIEVFSSSGSGFGNQDESSVINHDTIILNNCGIGFILDGKVENETTGQMLVSTTGQAMARGFYFQDTFINKGVLRVDNMISGIAYTVGFTADVTNSGTMQTRYCPTGFQLSGGGKIENSGLIEVLFCLISAGTIGHGVFTNSKGMIVVSWCNDGLTVDTFATLINTEDSILSISNITNDPLEVSMNATVDNEGQILIE